MYRLLIIFFVLCAPIFLKAQQTPLLSHYFENLNLINPSTVGFNDGYAVKFNGRQQWANFSENPIRNSSLSLTKGFGVNGIGFTVITDNSGNLQNSGFSLKYSYKTLLTTKSQLFFGLSGGYFNRSIQNVSQYDYPYLIENKNWIPNASFGMSYKRDEFIFGASIDGLLESDFGFTSANNIYARHVFSFMKYEFKASDRINIYPSFLYKIPVGGHSQYELNVNFEYQNAITFGIGYKGGMIQEYNFGPSVTLGFNIGKISSLYSQDIVLNDVSSYSSGTSEISLIYEFSKEPTSNNNVVVNEKKEEPIADRDGDSVPDNIDDCPDVFGSVEAKGCPDIDRDGVTDSEDLCPNTLGEILNGGCPILSKKDSAIINQAIQNLEFDVDSEVIKSSSFSALTDIAKLMLGNRNMVLIISGHTDSDASNDYNVRLSALRAKSVKDFFQQRGIQKHRLVMDFYGETKPLLPNDSEFNKSKNRRVEFNITFM